MSKCNCEWCEKTSPLIKKIKTFLNEKEISHFDKLMNDLIHFEMDSTYWKDKCYGVWPGDNVQSLKNHIKILQKRMKELKNGK